MEIINVKHIFLNIFLLNQLCVKISIFFWYKKISILLFYNKIISKIVEI